MKCPHNLDKRKCPYINEHGMCYVYGKHVCVSAEVLNTQLRKMYEDGAE